MASFTYEELSSATGVPVELVDNDELYRIDDSTSFAVGSMDSYTITKDTDFSLLTPNSPTIAYAGQKSFLGYNDLEDGEDLFVGVETSTTDNTPLIWGEVRDDDAIMYKYSELDISPVTLEIQDSTGATQTVTAEVNNYGSFLVAVPEDLADGAYTVTASFTDESGEVIESTDEGVIEPLMIAVNAVDSTTDSTPFIWGETNAGTGSVVTLEIQDSEGNVQTVTTTAEESGSFVAEVPESLATGEFTVTASVVDVNEGTTEGFDVGNIDAVSSSMIAVDAVDSTTDSTPVIWGQSTVETGSTVTLEIEDSEGATQTVSTTINESGKFAVSALEELAVGEFTVTALVSDEEGNTLTSTDVGVIEYSYSDSASITVSAENIMEAV